VHGRGFSYGVGAWLSCAGLFAAAGDSRALRARSSLVRPAYQLIPSDEETVVSQIARGVFGGRGLPYFLVQIATMLILVLAANTAYADFPRLASILARDRYVPRQLMNQGDRLAFSNGIMGLSAFAGILLVIYSGDTHSLIPLYMIGVFVSFTLSQAGMVQHWRRIRAPGWEDECVHQWVRCDLGRLRDRHDDQHDSARLHQHRSAAQ
jgi:hypothetical protein